MKTYLSLLLASIAAAAPAVNAEGSWQVHPVFAPPVTRAVDTPTDIFFLSGGSLFGYDKDADESVSYTADNYLTSAADIADLFYDRAAGRLLIAYADGNIDLLGPRRRVTNIPDIAAATSIAGSRAIRSVAFDADTAYVAGDFGLVKLDLDKGETLASGLYPSAVKGIALTPTHIVAGYSGGLYSLPRGARMSSPDALTRLTPWSEVTEMATLAPDRLLVNNGGTVYTLRVNPAATSASGATEVGKGAPKLTSFIIGDKGRVRFVTSRGLCEADSTGAVSVIAPLHPDIASDAIACYGDDTDMIWAAGRDGLACYGYDSADGWTLRSDRYRPEALSVKRVAFITPGADGSTVYFSNLGPTVYRLGYTTGDEGLNVVHNASRLEADGRFTDVSAYDAPAKYSLTASMQKGYGSYPLAPTQMAEDPDDPSTYWLGTGNDGLYRITDGRLTGRYDEANAPFIGEWGCRVYHVSFDRGGNMWVASHTGRGTSGIAVLPAAKRRLDPSEVTAADWTVVEIPGYSSNKDVRILHCRLSDMIFITDATVGTMLVAIDTRGTFGDLTDDRVKVWNTFTDQDGKTISPDRHTSLAEDHSGRVWIGTSGGVFYLADPRLAATDGCILTHVKVPRRDGTNTADYLLESDLVYDIAVDHADRKWLATDASGVFLVSPDGSEIISSYNSANSPLPSNRVNAVYCSPSSSAVYFGTDRGVVEYTSTASPAADDFSDIRVYPNPVGPETSGPVTITGLMDGSLVKIADAAGRVVWQGRSQGGMCQWPVTDIGGRRVRSGVYHVMASRSGQDVSGAGAVARVAVVN